MIASEADNPRVKNHKIKPDKLECQTWNAPGNSAAQNTDSTPCSTGPSGTQAMAFRTLDRPEQERFHTVKDVQCRRQQDPENQGNE